MHASRVIVRPWTQTTVFGRRRDTADHSASEQESLGGLIGAFGGVEDSGKGVGIVGNKIREAEATSRLESVQHRRR